MSLPLKIKEIVIRQKGTVKKPVKCVLQSISHDNYHAIFNIMMFDKSDGHPIMDIYGLEMFVMP